MYLMKSKIKSQEKELHRLSLYKQYILNSPLLKDKMKNGFKIKVTTKKQTSLCIKVVSTNKYSHMHVHSKLLFIK